MASTNITGHEQGPLQIIVQKSHREKEVPEIQEQVILSPEKGLNREKDHIRSFQPERLYPDHIVQKANFETGETSTPTRSIDSLT